MKASVFAFILAENVRNQLRRLLHVWRTAADLLSNWLLGVFEVQSVTPTRFGTSLHLSNQVWAKSRLFETPAIVSTEEWWLGGPPPPPMCTAIHTSEQQVKVLAHRIKKMNLEGKYLFHRQLSHENILSSFCHKCQYALIRPQIEGFHLFR